MRHLWTAVIATTLTIPAFSALGDTVIRPGQTEWVRGERVTCIGSDHDDNGHQGISRRAFRCASLQPSYPSLENQLRVTTTYRNGRTDVVNLFNFHFKQSCETIANDLNRACSSGGRCNFHFCEADNANYSTLNSSLYGVSTGRGGKDLRVERKESFSYMSECRSALRSYPNH